MSELPTATTPSTTPDAVRALASIEAAKLTAGADLSECLDTIGGLIKKYDDPDLVFGWVLDLISLDKLRELLAQHTLRLGRMTKSYTDEAAVTELVILWAARLVLVPYGQPPHRTLAQLHTAITEHESDERLGIDFQAAVAAGNAEDVEAWRQRVAQGAST